MSLTRVVKTFYQRQDFKRAQHVVGVGEIIRWWESRRLFFNVVVGCTGLVTCVLMIICAFTSDSLVGEPIGMTDGPLLGVFLIIPYAVLANVCYTGGWIAELLVRMNRKREDATSFGLQAFRFGITFSILISRSL